MKAFLLILTFCTFAVVRAQAQFRDQQIIKDLGDDGVAAIANRLGLHCEELGMGANRLGRGGSAFNVDVPGIGDENGGQRTPAQARKEALTLMYYSSRKHFPAASVRAWNDMWWQHFSTAEVDESGSASLTAKLFLVDGVTFRTALEHVRRFRDEIEAFEKPAKNN